MKEETYTELICKPYCKFYRPGKEALKCGSYEFLQKALSPGELRLLRVRGRRPHLGFDRQLKALACARCAFLRGGCDFRAGLKGPPCGGYVLLEQLLEPLSR
jgi:hypothetical protein